MVKYRRLSLEEREEISRLLSQGYGIREIARELGRCESTISREVGAFSRSRGLYRAATGHAQAKKRASSRRKGQHKLMLNLKLQRLVREKLKLYWSPRQIALFLKDHHPDMTVSAETLYTYIYLLPRGVLRKELSQQLRRKHKKRRVQGRSAKGQTSHLEDMISIEERPAEVADRSVPGHWEGDILIGHATKQTAMGTLVERNTRAVILVPLKNKTALEVRKAFAKAAKRIPQRLRLTLTYDQGREMAQHKLFTKQTKMQVYFCHPSSPWERGTCENTNGLLRDFFPKGTDFTKVTPKYIRWVEKALNTRPRQTLGWKTPQEKMAELLR